MVASETTASETRQDGEPSILLTIPDVVRLTRYGRTTIYAEIRAGRLRTRRLGASVRIHRDDLNEWINQQADDHAA